MAPQEFMYLVGGMMDVTSPETTEAAEDRVNRAVREMALKAHARAKSRRR